MIQFSTLLLLTYISSLLCSDDAFYDCVDDTEIIEQKNPNLGPKIYLFQPRNILTTILENPHTPQKIILSCKDSTTRQLLQTTLTQHVLSPALQTEIPETGCYLTRKDRLTQEIQHPQYIVLIMSNTQNIDDHLQGLIKNQRAYNFIINTNGIIHPITLPDEDIETAITHYPFSLGPTTYVQHGTQEIQDMNARSITISIIGKNQPINHEQTQSLIWLITYLQQKYTLNKNRVLDYTCIATPYGRKPLQSQIPWDTLAEANVALWPRQSDQTPNNQYFTIPKTLWMSLALRKIGFACPATQDPKNQTLINILTLFKAKYNCQQDPTKLIHALNSLMLQHEECEPEKFNSIFPTSYKTST